MLHYPLSHLAGVIKAVGAGIRSRGAPQVLQTPRGGLSSYLFVVAVGLILSTYKRRGPVCWLQLGLTVVYLFWPSRSGGCDQCR